MKKLILILGILLIGCCSADSDRNSKVGSLVIKTRVEFHHTENCRGHYITIERLDFQQEGHDMWLIGTSSEWKNIMHSPNCKKCNKSNSVLDTTTSDYFGW